MAEPAPSQDTQDDLDSDGNSPGGNSDSTNANNAPRPGSVKDRACPFCHQFFTSSSLGRHLDTFIRPKNPKAPDGIHDVTEIRKIRGNITRRHARISSAANRGSKQSSVEVQRPYHEPPPSSSLRSSHPAPPSNGPESPHSVFRSKADWMVTGVINDLPPRNSGAAGSRDALFSQGSYQDGRDPRDIEEKEIAKATELALKEVLSSVREAASDVRQSSPFDFDFLCLNFPALCLKILSPPPTLFSTTPTAAAGTWPLGLPSESIYHEAFRIVRDRINQRIVENRRKSEEISSPPNHSTPREWETEGSVLPEAFKPYVEHFQNAYLHWSQLPENQQREVWTLELMRALADEVRRTQTLDLKLDDAHREVKYLRAEIDSITHHFSWRRPQDMQGSQANAPASPTPPSLSKQTVKRLAEAHVDLHEWDYDRLVSKWRDTLRPRPRGNAPYQSLAHEPSYHESSATGSSQMDKLADAAAAVEQGRTTSSMGHVHDSHSLDHSRAQSEAERRQGQQDVEMRDDDNMSGPKTRRAFARQGAG